LVHGKCGDEDLSEVVDACEVDRREGQHDDSCEGGDAIEVDHGELRQEDLCGGDDAVYMGDVYDNIPGEVLEAESRVELSELERSIVDLISPGYTGDYSIPSCEWLSTQPNATVARVLLAIGKSQSRKTSIVVKARVEGKTMAVVRREERSLSKKKSDMKKIRSFVEYLYY
jgi:hypothetical protein